MSFFDPAGVFGGGGGGGFRDPLGIFGGGRRQMSPQELAQARGGGGQSQRANAFGGGFGGASGYRGQGMRESDFGGPAEMQPRQIIGHNPNAGNQWGPGTNDPTGEIARQQNNQLAMSQGRGAEIGRPAPQGGGMMFPGVGGGPQFSGFSGGKPAPMQGGPNPAAMMQSQGGQQWGQLASALAQQGGPQGMSGGIRRFANMGLQSSADPYGAPRRAMAGVRGGKFSGPRG